MGCPLQGLFGWWPLALAFAGWLVAAYLLVTLVFVIRSGLGSSAVVAVDGTPEISPSRGSSIPGRAPAVGSPRAAIPPPPPVDLDLASRRTVRPGYLSQIEIEEDGRE